MNPWRKLLKSFGYALDGLAYALVTQRNMRIHFFAAFVVTFLCVVIKVQTFEIVAALFSISLVIVLELVNTAIEHVVDLLTSEFRTAAKVAKDVAAAAVLIAAMNALVVAYLIFYNKLDPVEWRPVLTLIKAPYIGILLIAFLCLIVAIAAYAAHIRRKIVSRNQGEVHSS